MQKYVLATFLQPLPDGAEFTVGHWPLHTTLVANFALDIEATDLIGKLDALFSDVHPIKTVAIHDEHFGPQGQVHVTRLELTDELAELHNKAVALIRQNGGIFDEPQYLEAGYKPHVTVQADGRINEGEHIALSEVSLVDMFPGQNIRGRKIMQTFTYGSAPEKAL